MVLARPITSCVTPSQLGATRISGRCVLTLSSWTSAPLQARPDTEYLTDSTFTLRLPSLSESLRPQEFEVAALVGAQDLLRIELGIAARGLLARKRCTGSALLELGLVDQELDAARLHRQANAVAVAHQAERPARGSVGCHVQHDGAERSAAHARIGDAHHVLDALLRKLLGDRQV